MSEGEQSLHFIIPGQLAYVSASQSQIQRLKSIFAGTSAYFVSSDLHRSYFSLASDFGPVNLGVVHRFCSAFKKKLSSNSNRILIYCIQDNFADQANASFLLSSFMMIIHGWSPMQASLPFIKPSAPFIIKGFRDATYSDPTYTLSLMDLLEGLAKGMSALWYNFATFDWKTYVHLDNPYTGDIHEISPKFIAFKGPLSTSQLKELSEVAFSPEFYIPTFRQLGVTCIVRLNDPETYDRSIFIDAGLSHHDLYFDDCTIPSDEVVEAFLDISDSEGRVAVHCRAGLGRTGTLIALWLMKNHGLSANEAIAWLRIVRPGSVIGRQQQYLKDCESRGWRGNRMLPAKTPTEPRKVSPGTQDEDARELARQVNFRDMRLDVLRSAPLRFNPIEKSFTSKSR